jgi:hypothetical protein
MPLTITPSWKPLDAREKPPYSYATLIAHALLSSVDGQLKLCDIYTWIAHHYPFYALDKPGWQVGSLFEKLSPPDFKLRL